MMKLILFIVITISCNPVVFAQRYLNRSFETVELITDISYGTATNYEGESEVLLLDIYQPSGDVEERRPLIVYIHGGGFIDETQSKSLVHIMAYADSLAARGYVVASLNYRLDSSISNRAIVNAAHDAKLAVRYLKANALLYNINPDLIIVTGESAGAITALNIAYMNEPAEVIYPDVAPYADDLTVEGPGFDTENSNVKAVMCLCGGTETVVGELLFDTTAIQYSTDPPILILHGSADPLIPIAKSLEIGIRANNIELPFLFYNLPGATHCPWFFPLEDSWAYLDTLVDYTVPFLYACISGVAGIADEENEDYSIHYSPQEQVLNLNNREDYQSINKVNIYDINQRKVYASNTINQTKRIDLSTLNTGIYFVRIIGSNGREQTEQFVKY